MKVVNDRADDWDRHLASVVFGYRVNKQGSTKTSPFELMYGVKARLPIDIKGDVDDPPVEDDAVDQRVVELGQHLVDLRDKASENINDAQEKQKKRLVIGAVMTKLKLNAQSIIIVSCMLLPVNTYLSIIPVNTPSFYLSIPKALMFNFM